MTEIYYRRAKHYFENNPQKVKYIPIIILLIFSLATIETSTIVEPVVVPYGTTTKENAKELDTHFKELKAGQFGEKELSYRVKKVLFIPYRKELIKTEVTKEPINQVVEEGLRTKSTTTKTKKIPYKEVKKYSSGLWRGEYEWTSHSDGSKEQVFEVIKLRDKVISKKLVSENVLVKPKNKVITYGTFWPAGDYDCDNFYFQDEAQAFMNKAIKYQGYDHNLDGDYDGVACEWLPNEPEPDYGDYNYLE